MDLIFAYGSLVNRKEIERTLKNVGDEKDYDVLGTGKLNNYKLAFTKNSRRWSGGVLDVINSKDDYVLGLVLKVSDRAKRKIDVREGVSIGMYSPETVSIELDGELLEVYVYTVVDKEMSGIVASEEYVNKVETGMREEGFPEDYINKYLLGKVSEEIMLCTLRYIREEPHASDLFMIINTSRVKGQDRYLLVDCMLNGGYIRQDRRDAANKYDFHAKFYTVPDKRAEIDHILLKDQKESEKTFESIDCVNANLNHKTKVCMKCLITYKEGKCFCRKCMSSLEEIDTPMLDIIFDLNKKGYKTQYCCSGHPDQKIYSAYLIMNGIVNGLIAPNGFGLMTKDNKTTITSLNVKNGKLKLSDIDIEKLTRKNLSNLREWVLELTDQNTIFI